MTFVVWTLFGRCLVINFGVRPDQKRMIFLNLMSYHAVENIFYLLKHKQSSYLCMTLFMSGPSTRPRARTRPCPRCSPSSWPASSPSPRPRSTQPTAPSTAGPPPSPPHRWHTSHYLAPVLLICRCGICCPPWQSSWSPGATALSCASIPHSGQLVSKITKPISTQYI